MNSIFVLLFEHIKYFFPKKEIKSPNVITAGRKCFDQPIRNSINTFKNIINIATGQGNDSNIYCVLYYPYFKENDKLNAIDLSKKKAINDKPKAMEQINFIVNLEQNWNLLFLRK